MKRLFRNVYLFLFCGSLFLPRTAAVQPVTVIRDGIVIESNVANYIRNGRTYVSVKAFFEQTHEVTWDANTQTAYAEKDNEQLRFSDRSLSFVYNGENIRTDVPIEIVDGRMFVPLRALSETIGYHVSWNESLKTATLTLNEHEQKPDIPQYNDTDLYWLSRIICAESCTEPYEGKIAVGNVVLNRVASSQYPNTIQGVVFDRKYGVQFEPTANGTIYKTPDEECIRAAKACMDGENVIGNCLYFLNPKIASNKWIIYNCKYVTSIGGHDFYI